MKVAKGRYHKDVFAVNFELASSGSIRGSEPLFTASGEQYGFATLPENKASSGSPNTTDESEKNNNQEYISRQWALLQKSVTHCL